MADGTVEILKALADPTRLQIIAALARSSGPVCVCDFTARFGLSQSTISHHVSKLREAGLVESDKRGIWAYYRLRDDLRAPTTRLIDPARTARTSSTIPPMRARVSPTICTTRSAHLAAAVG